MHREQDKACDRRKIILKKENPDEKKWWSYYNKKPTRDERFVGFGGIDKVKFRGKVVPGDRLILIAKNRELRARRAIFDTQGVVDGKLVFEGVIIGMVV